MRIPDPKANTTTEAYLAYKAGYLEESELKPVLYEPYLHFDAWLAYWDGLTDTYPTDENGDPEMLTDEEALVAYLAGVTDTYPEEIKDPYDVRIVGYLRHLASIRWPEPDYPVNNEEFYLSTMEPTHTSNPVPSSDIELDTVEGKFISVEAYGDTYQQTYSGEQLLKAQGLATPTTETSFWSNITNQTITPLDNGWARFTSSSSSATKNFFIKRSNGFNWQASSLYTVICEIKNASSAGRLVFAQTQNADDPFATVSVGGQAGYTFDGTDHVFVFSGTTKSSLGSTGFRPFFSAAFASGSSVDLRLTIVAGDHIADYQNYIGDNYEPYVGGIPAPNPDYPQPIQVVTGEQTVTVTGKNLFDINSTVVQNFSATSSVISGNLRVTNGYSGSNHSVALKVGDTQDYSGKTLTLKTLWSSSGANTGRMYIGTSDSDGNNRTLLGNITTSGESVTVTIPTNITSTNNMLIIMAYSNNNSAQVGDYVDYSKIQLEQGSTPTTYEPYQSQSYTLDLGSIELCKIGTYQDYIYKSGDDWYVHKAVDKRTLVGTENWVYNAENAVFVLSEDTRHSNDGTAPYSNYFSGQANVQYYYQLQDGKCCAIIGLNRLLFKDINMANANDFKTWLSNHNTTVYYALATPTDTKITDATLVGELEALAGADTYNEKTYIKVTATDPNLPALLKVEAYKY